ncbi:MAG: hypothetical protein N2045_10345 [Fimbriimonadales bacterium]|nr:hypothetical protein [Fimbriimonadales bacterium]CUU34574.1 hypothetical protein DCOP10_10928 [Armatimonadetes bacterium DC]
MWKQVSLLLALLTTLALACAQPFTYQGFLKDGGNPANGNYDFEFRLFTDSTLLGTVSHSGVHVSNGLFSVELNFPAPVWDGGTRYLEIAVRRTGSDASYTTLSPRVKINPTPYASALRMFESGTNNPDRMVIAHSPGFTNWGLQYQDVDDKFNFLSGGTAVMTVDLGNRRVGIGTRAPEVPLHVVREVGIDTVISAQHTEPGGIGVYGVSLATAGFSVGIRGLSFSTAGAGVYGEAKADTGGQGVRGVSGGTNGIGVAGIASRPGGRGVLGWGAATTGVNYGVRGESESPDGTGVYGLHAATAGTAPGVHGVTNSFSDYAVGVLGEVSFTSPGGFSAAVRGINRGTGVNGIGVWGSQDGSGWGVYGNSVSGIGVLGWAAAALGINYGVLGGSDSPDGYGVFSLGRFAASGTKSFQIDHPLRPETHFLNHFCTEAPEPLNAYSGVVVLDARGEAWVQLPDYFESINRDPRYTLTPIGAPMPNLHVAVEIQNNRFKIAGGVPGKKVSWRVEAIRNDRWVRQYGYQTEQEKPEPYQGKYLHPELYGQPKERGIHYRPEPEPAPNERGKP